MHRHQILLFAFLSGCGPAAVPSAPVVIIAPSSPAHELSAPAPHPSAEVPAREPGTGSVTGTVRFFGQPPAPRAAPAKCRRFADAGRPFRVGPGHVVSDVLVAVTLWNGTPPRSPDSFSLELEQCSPSPRTVVLGPGQRLRITNRDAWPYTFVIGGDGPTAHTIASGATRDFLETAVSGRYQLTTNDSAIDVPIFVVAYATEAITDVAGRYRIERVPVGPARLSAYIPATNSSVELHIDVHAGESHHDLDLR